MKKLLLFLLVMLILLPAAAQTDLSGITICIDPGHGGNNPANDRHVVPEPGTDFWESESNFQKALLLKSLLEAEGATVILTRYTNYYPADDEPSLPARVATANSNNVDWFHSIHSNASGLAVNTSINYALMLVREKRSATDPGASTGDGWGVPEYPEAVVISDIMGPAIQAKLRHQMRSKWTYLDWTFYGGTNGGFSLGVLRGLLMPGELSEGSFHDFYPETRRLMNNAYRKMEAYALRNSFVQYFGASADTLCIVAGIQTQITTNALVNQTRVRVLPENIVYNGDVYNNGFYMIDGLPPGPHTIRFETPGYFIDSVQVTIAAGGVAFVDRTLVPTGYPTVMSSTPVDNDTAFAISQKVVINFSKPMDTSSVRNAFSIVPSYPGALIWANSNSSVTFDPDGFLPYDEYFTVAIGPSARSAYGEVFDGNGDGTPGDSFSIRFKTRFVDALPPRIVSRFPDSAGVVVSPNHIVNITFDEVLKSSSVTASTSNIKIQQVGGSLQSRVVQYHEAQEKGAAVAYLTYGLLPGKSYKVLVGGVSDTAGNAMSTTAPVIWEFSVASGTHQFTLLDSLTDGLAGWFASPSSSGSTTGHVADSTTWNFDPSQKVPNIAGNTGSARLKYQWNPAASSWLIRQYLNSGPAKSVKWRKESSILQAFVFGDGSKTLFRFCIDDNATSHEVSRWYSIDWVGWRLVEWDLQNDTTYAWAGGNGILDGDLNFDSFQLQYVPGVSAVAGQVYFDQLQIVQRTVTDVAEEPDDVPTEFSLAQNFPNPFNPVTMIHYTIGDLGTGRGGEGGIGGPGDGGRGSVLVRLSVYDLLGREVAVLVSERQAPGSYQVRFDGAGLASGVYLYRLTAGGCTKVRKMMMVR